MSAMSDSEHANGNGAARGPQRLREPMSLADHARQIQHDAEALAGAVREATDGVQRSLTAQVEQRPFSTVGVAAGVGYVLGGGLSSRLTATLLGAATRVAVALVARELGNRILQGGSPIGSGAAQERS
jgi:ElaB/YqjD/DUF883 family membrane-anchored ribosome-binding protein